MYPPPHMTHMYSPPHMTHTVSKLQRCSFFRAKEIKEKQQGKRKLKQQGKRKLKYQEHTWEHTSHTSEHDVC